MAEFEIRCAGMVMASASGPRESTLAEAMRYFAQYAQDATEEDPVELVEVIRIAEAAGKEQS